MGKSRGKAKPATPGRRVGTKDRDMRWEAPGGVVWSSRYEYELFLQLKEQGYNVRKTDEKDSLSYTSPVRGGRCLQCSSGKVVQEHVYTPDLSVGEQSPSAKPGSKDGNRDYCIEAKGYLRGPRRALLRHFRKARPGVDLRLVVQRDYRVSAKATITEWATKYLKVPVVVWPGRGTRFPGFPGERIIFPKE